MEDKNHRESSDMPSLGKLEPDPWYNVPGEKIFFNLRDNFILQKYSKATNTSKST
jgi:hypothetical protein